MSKISIIVPIYNVEKYLKQALDSCINQTLKDIEVICIDDCSTDSSFEILNEYAKKDSRIIAIKNKINLGTGTTRNKALDMATGDYILFLDPDDWFELNACELAYNQANYNCNDMLLFNVNVYYDDTSESKFYNRINRYSKYFDTNGINILSLGKSNMFKDIGIWSKLYSRKFLSQNNIKFTDTTNGEDVPYTVQCFMNSKNASFITLPLYNLRRTKYKSINLQRDRNFDNRLYEYFNNYFFAYNYITKFDCTNIEIIKKNFLVILIHNFIYRCDTFKNCKPTVKKMYKQVRKIFWNIYKKEDIFSYLFKLDCPIEYILCLLIGNYTIYSLCSSVIRKLLLILRHIFSITNEKDKKGKKYKIITIFGYKIKTKYIKNFVQNIFSIKNVKNKKTKVKHKIITILGIKLKFRKK